MRADDAYAAAVAQLVEIERRGSSRAAQQKQPALIAQHLDFAGNLDFCITIRTVLIEGGRAYVQAGAGIVADSNPEVEYEETRDKARGVIRALELAQAGL